MTRQIIPLSKPLGDVAIVAFFFINILFITYIVDLEQLVIVDPAHFTYPIWPPPVAVDAIHWWGRTFDPVLLARPAWWKITIWIDALFFGPFYIIAIYASIRGKEWIRIPTIIYASALLTVVLVILGEEIGGTHATPHLPVVLLANLPWLLFPIYIIYRMWHYPTLFTLLEQSTEAQVPQSFPERTAISGGENSASINIKRV